MSDPKQTSERLQAIMAESKRAARETQALIDRTHKASEAYARLARALSEVGADLKRTPLIPRGGGPKDTYAELDERRAISSRINRRCQRICVRASSCA